MSDFDEEFGDDFEDLGTFDDFDTAEFDNIEATPTQTRHIGADLHLDTSDIHDFVDDYDLDAFEQNVTHTKSAAQYTASPTAGESEIAGTSHHRKRKIKKQKAYTDEELQELQYRRMKYQKGRALLDIIKLDHVSFDIFTLPPRSEYDLYVTSMGGKFRQTSVQAPVPEERKNQGMNTMRSSLKITPVQLRELKTCSIAAQVPDDVGLFSEATRHLHTTNRTQSDEGSSAPQKPLHQVNSLSLSKFLERVLPVVEEFLEDNLQASMVGASNRRGRNASTNTSSAVTQHHSQWKFTSTYRSLFDPNITSNRDILDVAFSSHNQNDVIVCYSTLKDPSVALISEPGLICVWNMLQPGTPSKILVSESEFSKMCVLPDKPHYVVASTKDGSIQLWNTKEPERQHIPVYGKQKNSDATSSSTPTYYKRTPTYSTDWLIEENHPSPIVDLKVLGYNAPVGIDSDASGSSNQLASLDQDGNMIFWVIVELQESVVSETDFGLAVGGNVKLVKGGQINVFSGETANSATSSAANGTAEEDDLNDTFSFAYQNSSNILGDGMDLNLDLGANGTGSWSTKGLSSTAYSFECEPLNATQFIIGTEHARVWRQSRFMSIMTPQHFKCDSSGSSLLLQGGGLSLINSSTNSSHISALHFSRHSSQCFLAALSNGSIHLFDNSFMSPLYSVTSVTEHEIVRLRWHPVFPSVFFVLDSKSHLYIFDLAITQGDKVVYSQNVSRENQTGDALSGDSSMARARIFELSAPQSGTTRIAFGYSNGHVDVHDFSAEFQSRERKELDLKELSAVY